MMPRLAGRTASPWLVLGIVCAGQLMVAIDLTIVNVALPTIQQRLHFSATGLSWVFNAYTLVFGGFLLLGGRLGDLFGRRLLFVAGMSVFTAGSLLCALAVNAGELVAFRAVQGLGAALLAPAVVSIITIAFPGERDRTRALSVWGGVSAVATALGVVLGGVLTQALSWPWIFYVNIPVGIVTVLAALRWVPESRAATAVRRFDIPGAVLVTSGLLAAVYAIVKAQSDGWGSASTVTAGIAAIVLLALFVLVERHHPAPLIRLGLLRLPGVWSANVATVLLMGANQAFFFIMTLYLQQVLHYSPLRAGLAFIPLSIGMLAGANLAARLIPRIGVTRQAVFGLLVSAVAFLLLLRLGAGGDAYFTRVLPALALNSFGLGSALVALTVAATSGVPARDAGLASGLINTAMQAGGALGLAVLTTIAASRTSSVLGQLRPAAAAGQSAAALVQGFHLAFLVGAGFFALAGAVLVLARRRTRAGARPPAPAGDATAPAQAGPAEPLAPLKLPPRVGTPMTEQAT
jgi:EmrB/QacA subfamily drug resistance transporter